MSEANSRVMELKWEMERAIDVLNVESERLAVCAVWDVVDTLTVTLIGRGSKDENLVSLAAFIRNNWRHPDEAEPSGARKKERGL